MKAEMLALSTAIEAGQYDYLHLISGVDLPLKSQNFIHNFFDGLPIGTNCVSIANPDHIKEIFDRNCKYFHLFTDKLRCKNNIKRKICTFLRRTFVKFQRVCRFKRNWDSYTIGKGTNWVSVSYDFAKYLVDNQKRIFRKFKGIPCVDEIYKQTMLLSSEFKDTRANFETVSNCVRRIDWTRGEPYVWRMTDYEELSTCNELFARKFSSSIDKQIIDAIVDMVNSDSIR